MTTPVLFLIFAIFALVVIILYYVRKRRKTMTSVESETRTENTTTSGNHSLETVLSFLHRDLEKTGYEDAFLGDEDDNKRRKLRELKSLGIEECNLAIESYEKNIITIDSKITIATRGGGYSDTIDTLKADKEKQSKDIDIIKTICIDLKNDVIDSPVFNTYIKGFDRHKIATLKAGLK